MRRDEWIDISPPIDADLAVWPGDTPPRREVLLSVERGDSVTLSTLHATVHLGAHADAPSHFAPGGAAIDAVEPAVYVGPCRLIRPRARPAPEPIGPQELAGPIDVERILLDTGSHPDRTRFPEDLTPLSPPLIDALADAGVRLVGVDAPSVDRFDSKDLPVHHRSHARGLAILEGLALAGVPEGVYELIALPLRLAGFDASPVRAVLRRPAAEPRGGGRS